MTEDKLINFPTFLLIVIVLVAGLAGLFSGLNAIDKKVGQKYSILVATPEEFTLGGTTFVLRPDTEILLTPETKKPYLAVYVPKEEMSDEEANLFYDGLWKYHNYSNGLSPRTPFFVSFTSLPIPNDCYSKMFYCRIKNDWFSFSTYNRTLIVVNEVNYQLCKKEQDKIMDVKLKEFWGK